MGKKKDKSSAKTQQTLIQASYSGPLPQPNDLARYDEVYPGAAEIIIKRFESQGEHRQGLEKTVVWHNEVKSYLGWASATIIAIITICGGIYLINTGKDVYGLGAIISSLVALVGVFIIGKISQHKELENKRR